MAEIETDARERVSASFTAPGSLVAALDEGGRTALWAQRAAKRGLDVVGAGLGLVLLAPLLLVVGLVIKLESRGPALFRQVRLGKDGELFTFCKFRTMTDGNDPAIHRQYVRDLILGGGEELQGDSGAYKIEHDPRVTRVGGFLRRWSVDELPQLLNVLAGDMSLVGPRPPLPYEAELYSGRARRRLECAPGITGWWQVNGRCHTTFDEMVALDLEYIDNWSFRLDIMILLRTVGVVLSRKGAW